MRKDAAERIDKALWFIYEYGGIDGADHKQWVLNGVVRELTGPDYDDWVRKYQTGDEGPETYKWDVGIAP